MDDMRCESNVGAGCRLRDFAMLLLIALPRWVKEQIRENFQKRSIYLRRCMRYTLILPTTYTIRPHRQAYGSLATLWAGVEHIKSTFLYKRYMFHCLLVSTYGTQLRRRMDNLPRPFWEGLLLLFIGLKRVHLLASFLILEEVVNKECRLPMFARLNIAMPAGRKCSRTCHRTATPVLASPLVSACR
jgi:hypothetical protein